jgi:hypothetical protein
MIRLSFPYALELNNAETLVMSVTVIGPRSPIATRKSVLPRYLQCFIHRLYGFMSSMWGFPVSTYLLPSSWIGAAHRPWECPCAANHGAFAVGQAHLQRDLITAQNNQKGRSPLREVSGVMVEAYASRGAPLAAP